MTDFDSGLLHSSFEKITGSSEDKYEELTQRLINVLSRLYNLKPKNENNKEFNHIIKEIEKFFDEDELPIVTTDVNDYKEREGRIISLKRDDVDVPSSCVPEIFNKAIDRIGQEQYFKINNKIKLLIAKAKGLLDDTVFNWHREDMIEEITPGMEENNGGSAKPEQ